MSFNQEYSAPKRPWRLRTRLAIALIVVFAPISVLLILSHIENREDRRETRVESLRTIADTIAAVVDGFTRDLESFSLSAAVTLGEAAASPQTQYNQENLGSYFRHLHESYGILRAVFLTDTGGKVVASDTGQMNGFDLSGRNYIQALQQGAESAWSGSISGALSGQTTLAHARVIRRPDGTPINYLVIALYPSVLADRLSVDLPEGATISLIDEHGLLLYTTKETTPDSPPPDFASWTNYIKARDGEAAIVNSETTPNHAEKRYGAYVPVARYGWVVGLTVPTVAVDGPVESRFRRDLLIMAALLATGFFAMLVIASRLSRPLSRLAAIATAITHGERPTIPTNSADADVRELEEAMATMTRAIANREERLESQARVLQALDRVGEALATELDFQRAVASVTQAAIGLTNADLAALFLKSPDTGAFELTSHASSAEAFPLTADDPLLQPVWAGDTVHLPDIAMLPELDRQRRPEVRERSVRSLFGAPISSREGEVQGALVLLDSQPNAFDEYDERRAVGLTRRAAIVLENARLFSQSQEMQEKLRKANVAKDEFLAVISHELRTPITTIYGGARLLQSRGSSLPQEATAEMITSLEEEAERLYRLVEDLLTIARSELGEEPTMEPLPLGPLVEQVVRQFAHRRPNRPVEIRIVGERGIVMGETTYLRQILNNLLTNSDKYSDAGLPIEIEIGAGPDESVVSVLDRGPGVAPEELDSIFDSFYRSRSTAKQAGGKGLGLTVCKRLIEAMSGRIWASAREGGGLVVSFSLPNADDLDPIPDTATSDAGASPS